MRPLKLIWSFRRHRQVSDMHSAASLPGSNFRFAAMAAIAAVGVTVTV
ncbi:MAG: hypothetical protein ACJASK_001832, partial [Ilumatobacter sp.]